MSDQIQNLKNYIRELVNEVEEELEEATATGNVDGYSTPHAFSSKKHNKRRKDTAKQAGYTIVDDDVENITEGYSNKVISVVKDTGSIKRFNVAQKFAGRFASGDKHFRGADGVDYFLGVMKKNNIGGVDIIKALTESVNEAKIPQPIQNLIDDMVKGKVQARIVTIKDPKKHQRFMKDVKPAMDAKLLMIKHNPINKDEMKISLGPKAQDMFGESKVTMNNLDWGKSTAERNSNLDKFKSLKSDKDKNEFLKKLKGESVNEEKVYIDFLNKKKGFKRDRKDFDSYEKAVKWAKKNFEKFSHDMIHYESVDEAYKHPHQLRSNYPKSKMPDSFDIELKDMLDADPFLRDRFLSVVGYEIHKMGPAGPEGVVLKLKKNDKAKDIFKKLKKKWWVGDSVNEDEMEGGLADKYSLEDIANKHKVDIDSLMPEYRDGIKVEMEHTKDAKVAAEIARDHLYEDPKYYTKLSIIENESVNEAIGMDMGARKRVYDKLKKGDKVEISYGSSIKNHKNTFVVTKDKTKVGKQRVERMILKNVDNMKGVSYYLYNRDGNVGMAIGDMGAVIKSMNPVNESINEGLEPGDKLTHKHNKDISIELVATTNRGWKVKQTEPKGPRSKKTTIQYYDSQDISGDKSLFEAKKPKRRNRWLELKNDDRKPNKKLAVGLKELKYKLREVEKFLNWYNKISKMNELSSDSYWKRTHTNIYKIKERLINIANTIKELEQ